MKALAISLLSLNLAPKRRQNPWSPLAHWNPIIAPLMRGNNQKDRAMAPVLTVEAITIGEGSQVDHMKCSPKPARWQTMRIVKYAGPSSARARVKSRSQASQHLLTLRYRCRTRPFPHLGHLKPAPRRTAKRRSRSPAFSTTVLTAYLPVWFRCIQYAYILQM